MWIKEKFSREYHVVCNGKTNHPCEKRSITAKNLNSGVKQLSNEENVMIGTAFLCKGKGEE